MAAFEKMKLGCMRETCDREIISFIVFDALKLTMQASDHFSIFKTSVCRGREALIGSHVLGWLHVF